LFFFFPLLISFFNLLICPLNGGGLGAGESSSLLGLQLELGGLR
jgi:hypothetical protein